MRIAYLLLILSAALHCSTRVADAQSPNNRCAEVVQGRIAWDYRGSTRWSPTNVERLCAGAESSVDPARCFQIVMHSGVSHGEGTQWGWQDAIELCKGTLDHRATLGCFSDRIRSGLSKVAATDACRWTAPQDSPAPPPAIVHDAVRTIATTQKAPPKASDWPALVELSASETGVTGVGGWAGKAGGPFVLSRFLF